ncbi:hypothetical protein ERHA54_40130 [Erwinia rhapontici]|nr:hypothetical protein ERHA54_40130 [Erwinia rhapontici]
MANVRDLSTDFTHLKTAKRQLAALVALSLTSGAAFAAAEQTINVTADAGSAPQESAWGPARPLRQNTAPPAPKPIHRLRKTRSLCLLSPARKCKHISLCQ